MHTRSVLRFGAALVALACASAAAAQTESPERPNFLLIVADDLGFSDLASFGGEIHTPTLDQLAAEGTRLTGFYAAPFCSPSRAMLMTGADNHEIGFGAMTELVPPEIRETPGYEGYLNDSALAFPVLLQDAGYRTYLSGKWHLGTTPETSPDKRGFDRSYALVQGGAGHFNQNGIIAVDPDVTPKALYREDGVEVDLPEDFYSSEFFVDQLIGYLEEDRDSADPFFAYLAFTAPHWPLQARDADIAAYDGVYDGGYDVIREERHRRMEELGIIPAGTDIFPGNAAWPAWDELEADVQASEARRMQVYAAMVNSMDRELGRLIAYLDETGALDNTFIFFMSDNGADGNTARDVAATREWIERHFDNSIENTGRATSNIDYGPGWAQVGSTPLRLYKAFLHEGGIRVPAIAVLPKALRQNDGQVTPVFAHTMDVAPTILDFAGVAQPGTSYKGREIAPIRGSSMRPFLTGVEATVHGPEQITGWELQGRRALRKGNWKIVSSNTPWGTGDWELYDLAADPAELADLSDEMPEKLAELTAAYDLWAEQTGVLDLRALSETVGYSNGLSYYDDVRDDIR